MAQFPSPKKHVCTDAEQGYKGDDQCSAVLSFDNNGSFSIKTTHDYWNQIQGQLYLTGTECDLVIWTTTDMQIVRIVKDKMWAPNISAKTLNFYFMVFLEVNQSEEEEKKEMVNRVQWVQRADEEEKKKEMMYIVQQVQRADEKKEIMYIVQQVQRADEDEKKKEMMYIVQQVQRADEEEKKEEMMYIVQQVQKADEEEKKKEMLYIVQWVQRAEEEKKEIMYIVQQVQRADEEKKKKEMVNRVQWVQRAEEEKKKEMMYIVQQVQRADEKEKECIRFGELRRCRRGRCFTECNRSGFCCTGWIHHI
ncbi:trichohyalin-like [Crassostrea angulata]|uniref:trichohyalin-like n=1 Tax=Magallana angulata TaxID=2784310 RepID=UPI0022B08B3E|nr:trichohyalin-like [Crassostrea angulata]